MKAKVALITGGAKGIGRALALDMTQAGWRVVICYRTSEKEANQVIEDISNCQGSALAIKTDVSDPVQAVDLIRQVEKQWGCLDALIHCAGPYHRVNLLDETIQGWQEMFDNNLHPVFYLSQAVAAGMKARKWGRIITFSMANADRMLAQPELTAHYISKVGVLVLTRSLAKLLAPYGVTVNALSPGFIDSGSAPKEELEVMAKKIPAGYIGDPQDAVSIVRFLLSDEARYVNGANIHLSGAWGI